MTRLLASVSAYTGFLVLGWSGYAHSFNFRSFDRALALQGINSKTLRSMVVGMVTVTEISLGTLGFCLSLAGGGAGMTRLILFGTTLCYFAFTLHTARLFLTDRKVPCGCSTDENLNGITVGRAFTLGIITLFASFNVEGVVPAQATTQFLQMILASASFAVLASLLPSLLAPIDEPSRYSKARAA